MNAPPFTFLTHGRWLLRALLLLAYGVFCGWSAGLLFGFLVERQFGVEVEALIGIEALMLACFVGAAHALVCLWDHVDGLRHIAFRETWIDFEDGP
jgi:hypothetical protein